MTGIELYIENQLCDTESIENFSIYLRRQFINPSELSVKDAQRSYDVTLPATAVNNAIFGYTNTEEVRGKFTRLYDAVLYAGGVKVFDGKFKISEITKQHYKGNLGVPAPQTVKDIFGDMKMNEAGEWSLRFTGYESITEYNMQEKPPCFFPHVLYGLLPKKQDADGVYSERDVIDNSVVLGLDDFPPSINCLDAMRHIFKSKGYTITGSAFADERLSHLYMSYKNPNEYPLEWNYGKMFNIALKGNWTNAFEENGWWKIESVQGENSRASAYNGNLLHGSNSRVEIIKDDGQIVRQTTTRDFRWLKDVHNTHIVIPQSGLYKLRLKTRLDLTGDDMQASANGITVKYHHLFHMMGFGWKGGGYYYEVKLLRFGEDQDVDLDSVGFDNTYLSFGANEKYALDPDGNPIDAGGHKMPTFSPWDTGLNFIDPARDPNLLVGMSYGMTGIGANSLRRPVKYHHSLMAVKGGKSFYPGRDKWIYAVTPSEGYRLYKNGKYEFIEEKTKFKIDLEMPSGMENSVFKWEDDAANYAAYGEIYQIVWLDKGDKIALVSSSGKDDGKWVRHDIKFELDMEAFRVGEEAKEWVKLKEDGSGDGTMKWGDAKTFSENTIDLAHFLPSSQKVDEWVNGFCKTFNLDLVQSGNKTYALNAKQALHIDTSLIIDLDAKADVNVGRTNQSLCLPSTYEMKFAVNNDEEGYASTQIDGGGKLETSSLENKKLSSESPFSYAWYKPIKDEQNGGEDILLPVITDKEVWDKQESYQKMLPKVYYDNTQRFWYKSKKNAIRKLGLSREAKDVKIALASDKYEGEGKSLQLDYGNQSQSILHNYFALITDVDAYYTLVECYLTPQEYENIGHSIARLNGDVYYIAEVDGYDPLGKKKARMKLIRRMM